MPRRRSQELDFWASCAYSLHECHPGWPVRKVIFAINMTTDGYCSHTDMIADEELHEYFTRVLRNADLLLYGRTTYQLMVPYWPDVARTQSEDESTNEFARVFDSLDKVVFSTTLKDAEGKKTRILSGNVAEEVIALKQQPGKDIGVGSLSIASQLSDRGLIDEYHFVIHPIVAGKGPRLFETVKLQDRLRLVFIGSTIFQSGVVALHYKKHA
jgi:dihydrofolate reductase